MKDSKSDEYKAPLRVSYSICNKILQSLNDTLGANDNDIVNNKIEAFISYTQIEYFLTFASCPFYYSELNDLKKDSLCFFCNLIIRCDLGDDERKNNKIFNYILSRFLNDKSERFLKSKELLTALSTLVYNKKYKYDNNVWRNIISLVFNIAEINKDDITQDLEHLILTVIPSSPLFEEKDFDQQCKRLVSYSIKFLENEKYRDEWVKFLSKICIYIFPYILPFNIKINYKIDETQNKWLMSIDKLIILFVELKSKTEKFPYYAFKAMSNAISNLKYSVSQVFIVKWNIDTLLSIFMDGYESYITFNENDKIKSILMLENIYVNGFCLEGGSGWINYFCSRFLNLFECSVNPLKLFDIISDYFDENPDLFFSFLIYVFHYLSNIEPNAFDLLTKNELMSFIIFFTNLFEYMKSLAICYDMELKVLNQEDVVRISTELTKDLNIISSKNTENISFEYKKNLLNAIYTLTIHFIHFWREQIIDKEEEMKKDMYNFCKYNFDYFLNDFDNNNFSHSFVEELKDDNNIVENLKYDFVFLMEIENNEIKQEIIDELVNYLIYDSIDNYEMNIPKYIFILSYLAIDDLIPKNALNLYKRISKIDNPICSLYFKIFLYRLVSPKKYCISTNEIESIESKKPFLLYCYSDILLSLFDDSFCIRSPYCISMYSFSKIEKTKDDDIGTMFNFDLPDNNPFKMCEINSESYKYPISSFLINFNLLNIEKRNKFVEICEPKDILKEYSSMFKKSVDVAIYRVNWNSTSLNTLTKTSKSFQKFIQDFSNSVGTYNFEDKVYSVPILSTPDLDYILISNMFMCDKIKDKMISSKFVIIFNETNNHLQSNLEEFKESEFVISISIISLTLYKVQIVKISPKIKYPYDLSKCRLLTLESLKKFFSNIAYITLYNSGFFLKNYGDFTRKIEMISEKGSSLTDLVSQSYI